ncbi:DUF4974 domain-containing protein [Paraflavitalea soli]|uniref:DUF4974 domain-containing protein n=1 Tax=Paraflavitalea soli TaxID=2315862 RepID=A0A3B7MI01_9BACT|nr:FecR family protein [Paraflavitalea soli]AXY73207.1 DUF4974 domain-containing protein [Paraflavitalea soli]
MLNEAQLKDLLDKALAGKASEAELRSLADALKEDEDFVVTDQIAAVLGSQSTQHVLPSQQRVAQLADQILSADKLAAYTASAAPRQAPLIALWKKIAIAAAILAVVATISFYFLQQKKHPQTPPITHTESNIRGDVNPGNNKARLILADGSVVDLDSVAKGLLSLQGRTQISKCTDGQVSYLADDNAPKEIAGAAVLYNKIDVPRGGQYQLILSDGTQVWLNAASSLRYPVAFKGNERVVELEGEGYFEVAKDAARPFSVRTTRADVQVLGTHFNVCSYAGEDWKTTLLEGRVAVKQQAVQALLKPGNQAILVNNNEKLNLVSEADVSEAIAWKEGYFQYNDATIPAIMQQVSRWYDVDIVYKDTVSKRTFNGKIKRATRLSGIVKALKEGGINCAIDANRLLVYP